MRLRMEAGAAASNLKRGPGGVVDIEFAVQLLQLLHGGRLPAVRTPNTLAGLDALAAAGLIEAASAESLRIAYDLLRSIECSLRLLDVRLGHDFPESAEARDRLAALLGRASGSDLAAEVAATTARVRQIFHQVFDAAAATAAQPAGG